MSDEKLHRVLSSGGRQGRISQLRATLRECNRLMEPMPSMAMAELDRLEREEKMCQEYEASITTTCARCSDTIDLAAVEQHHERCFVVGDAVRWDGEMTDGSKSYRWLEGVILEIDSTSDRIKTHVRVTARSDDGFAESIYLLGMVYRHIQRPRQVDPVEARAAAYHKLASEAPGPIGCAHGDDDDDELQDAMERVALPSEDPWEQDPMDALYDGVTLRVLLECDDAARREAGPHWRNGSQRTWTAPQREAVSAYHSAVLRARISAANERERLSVTYCEVDAEDEPW